MVDKIATVINRRSTSNPQKGRLMHSERLDQAAGNGENPPPAPSNPMSRIEFERLFGGRVLAWIGGLATLLGIVFLMRSAVDSSWFTEEVRALLAAFGSLAPSSSASGCTNGRDASRWPVWRWLSRFPASLRRPSSPPRSTT
jgi:hypothetical protein